MDRSTEFIKITCHMLLLRVWAEVARRYALQSQSNVHYSKRSSRTRKGHKFDLCALPVNNAKRHAFRIARCLLSVYCSARLTFEA